MTLREVVLRFNTTPFLFAGSGITRRYYGLPGWEELLKGFAERISKDRFSYASYKSKAQDEDMPYGILPQTASLIQRDFDHEWFTSEEIRSLDESGLRQVENGVSPFKAEIAAQLSACNTIKPEYTEEVKKLKSISKKNIAGIITTNYDLFFESLFEDYKSYVGQDELVFSAIQGVAEIYKIHGSVSKPETIVINSSDYAAFAEKGKYLAAKLLTIFMEYPIVFIGYSLADQNIRNILTDIVACLPNDKFDRLQERFVFVEYKPGTKGAVVAPYSIDLNGRLLNMTRVTTDSFSPLYDALAAKEAKMPIKLLRRFKEEIYTYVITSKPGPFMQVASLDDEKIDEDKLCVSIGQTNTGEYGLKNIIDANVWYRDIITDELAQYSFSYEKRLDLAFSSAFKSLNGYFPVHKYLSHVDGDYPNVRKHAASNFEDLVSKTIRNQRRYVSGYSSVMDLWQKEKNDLPKATRLMGMLPEEKIDPKELYTVLKEIFSNDEDALTVSDGLLSTHLKRLIRFYDYLRWGRK